jgi:UDP-N-acetylglucosamine 2-epimerase (non-hydrolysing)
LTLVCLVAGARPNFMKVAPVARALATRGAAAAVVHTGQHYDERMSEAFFRELEIPPPVANLGVGSGSAVAQTAEILRRLEPVLGDLRPDWVVVVGDVTSTVAAALTASKLGLPLAHVEAGLRSFDRTMPEELNRIVTDALAERLFVSEPSGVANLTREGIDAGRIVLVGNVMIDTLLANLARARTARAWERFGLRPREFALATLHRPSNVDVRENLLSILTALEETSKRLPVLLPLHPRTRKRIDEFGLAQRASGGRVQFVEPLGYLDTISLIDAARLVLTDSGGMQEETTVLHVPCLTLRKNTERPVTVEMGTSRLVGSDRAAIVAAVDAALAGPARFGRVPEIWDGKAAERIAANLCAPRGS